MIDSILKLLPWLAQIIAQWPERHKEAARKAWGRFRASYELKKENRRRRADLLQSVDRLRDNEGKLP